MANEAIEKLGNLVRERQGLEKKLSITYSLAKDGVSSNSKSLFPLNGGRTKSYSFQRTKKENVGIFHTLSNTSSAEESSVEREISLDSERNKKAVAKAKAKTPNEVESSNNDDQLGRKYQRSPSIN